MMLLRMMPSGAVGAVDAGTTSNARPRLVHTPAPPPKISFECRSSSLPPLLDSTCTPQLGAAATPMAQLDTPRMTLFCTRAGASMLWIPTPELDAHPAETT